MQRRDSWLFFIICVSCLLVMLPRILSAQFGLLDDAVLLLNAEQSITDLDSILHQFRAAGRFLPTTALLRGFVFSFSGFSPFRWYIWSTFELMAICLVLAYIARRHGFSILQALLSVLFFLASPTMIENFYTLSKSEIPMLLFISSAILLASSYRSAQNQFTKIMIMILCFILLLIAYGTKETLIVLPFIFLSWPAISWIYAKKAGEDQVSWQSDMILLVGSVIGGILYWVAQSMLGYSSQTTYAEGYQLFNAQKMLFNFLTLLGWLIRDYPYLLPLLISAFLLKPIREAGYLVFTVRWMIWMIAWLAILLPWYYLSYYFLPFLFGGALFSGAILGKMLELLRFKEVLSLTGDSKNSPYMPVTISRKWLWGCCITASLLVIPPAINANAYAKEQLTFDKANWQIVEQVRSLPANSQLFLNIPPEAEYFYEFQLYVSEIYGRPDIKIKACQPLISLPSGKDIYVASPIFLYQVLPRVRALNGPSIIEWRQSLNGLIEGSELIYSTRIRGPVLDIGFHRMLSFLKIGDMIGDSDRNMFVATTIDYGWDLWKYSSSE